MHFDKGQLLSHRRLAERLLGLPHQQSSLAPNTSTDAKARQDYRNIERQRISGLHRAKEPAAVSTVDSVLKEVG